VGGRAIVRVQREPFDAAAESAALSAGRTDVGAVVTFTGLCRDEAGKLARLDLEHYPGMAEAELGRVAEDALQRWPLLGLTIVHRYGPIHPGEPIVLVVSASSHRTAAFEAAQFLMDYLKSNAPFWKKEVLAEGAPGGWVAAKRDDETALVRWSGMEAHAGSGEE
jgi:molybdopterin synthase catalytic subunit